MFGNVLIFLKIIISWLPRIILCYLLFVIGSMLVPPLFRVKLPENKQTISKAPKSDKERVMTIESLHDAEFWRYKVLSAAKKSVDITFFDYRNDMGGLTFTSVLMNMADKGVKVRLLVDGYSAATVGRRFFTRINKHPNIEVRVYNPINLLTPWTFNYRMHDKMIIVDDDLYITGGRNQNSLFIGNYDDVSRKNQDRELLVYQGDKEVHNSLVQLKDYFEELWNLEKVQTIKKPLINHRLSDKKDRQFEMTMKELQVKLMEEMPEAFEMTNWQEVTFPTQRVDLLRGSTRVGNKPPLLYNSLLKTLKKGTKAIIETPYLILYKQQMNDFVKLIESGARISVLTNSPECGANPIGTALQTSNRSSVVKMGAKLYEYIGPKSQHTKTILIDDHISIIGSFNYDMRSIYLQTELMVCVDSLELNAELMKHTQAKIDTSRQILPNGGMEYGPDSDEVGLSKVKKLYYKLVHILTYPFRYLL